MSNREMNTDVILIGAGIMSATLGALLKELVPEWQISVYERRASAGEESSNEWNNAGTGHSSLCELNYTVEQPDGSIDISKAIKVNEEYQFSKQFWSYVSGRFKIRSCVHIDFYIILILKSDSYKVKYRVVGFNLNTSRLAYD